MADQDITKMKVVDLRRELKNRGLNTVGNKTELMERLQAAILDGNDTLGSIIEDDVLNEDDVLSDDELDEEKSLLDSTHDDILKSPAQSTKSDSPEDTSPVVKRVSLKRNVSVSVPVISETKKVTEESTDVSAESPSESASLEPEKKIIKISEMTAKDRLELRAKKFANASAGGTTVSSSTIDKKEARAARFGITATSETKPSDKITSTPSASIDVLKKRAERFGAATSTELKKTENDEKMQKRLERFGASSTTNTTTTTATATGSISLSKVDYAEKARLRAERFKTAV